MTEPGIFSIAKNFFPFWFTFLGNAIVMYILEKENVSLFEALSLRDMNGIHLCHDFSGSYY